MGYSVELMEVIEREEGRLNPKFMAESALNEPRENCKGNQGEHRQAWPSSWLKSPWRGETTIPGFRNTIQTQLLQVRLKHLIGFLSGHSWFRSWGRTKPINQGHERFNREKSRSERTEETRQGMKKSTPTNCQGLVLLFL